MEKKKEDQGINYAKSYNHWVMDDIRPVPGTSESESPIQCIAST